MRPWMAAIALVASLGCDGSNLRTLTRSDVMGIPAGDATGSAFSGQYLTTQNRVEACRCRAGSCATLRANVGEVGEVVQMDGSLQLVDPRTGQAATGGVNADGTFHLAYLREDIGNVQYALAEGNFTVAGGTPVSMELAQEATGVNGGIDCDVRMRASLAYLGPLTVAGAEHSLVADRANAPERRGAGFGSIAALWSPSSTVSSGTP